MLPHWYIVGMKEAYFTFAGQIDNQSSARFFASINAALNAQAERIHLLIQSSGGYVGDGVALFNYLKNLPAEVITYNAGTIASTAVTVFLAGKIRRASETATFMLHKSGASIASQAIIGADALRNKAESVELDDLRTGIILRSHIEMPQDKWELHARGDLHLSAKAAKNYGLIHEISDFKIPAEAQVFNI